MKDMKTIKEKKKLAGPITYQKEFWREQKKAGKGN